MIRKKNILFDLNFNIIITSLIFQKVEMKNQQVVYLYQLICYLNLNMTIGSQSTLSIPKLDSYAWFFDILILELINKCKLKIK